ncbi:ABC-type dipeptide/oligopeptide/nickel transport system, ATPase component [Lachnospiraceae bacterium XBD2001]|jgi:peptide/nickel transport system ATP-binding protein|nr:ABC-type dipeptide/oligopeptide/nickel transport system, ATPase component [Lachnospiraceae bacterium XBD2001]
MNDKITILRGQNITKKYKSNGRKVQALGGLDFSLQQGEILGIVGESGSGKSTLLKMICGMEKPDEGQLFHENEEYTGAHIGKTGGFLQMVFQDAYGSFDPRMTMKQSLLEIQHVTMDEILDIIKKVGLEPELLERKPRQLSGGQCQRMSIARALLSHVDILLCDEITSALDVTTQAQVVKLLLELRREEGLSLVFVSHDLALVSQLCDRVMVLKDGVCVEAGDTKTVITQPKNAYTKLLLENVITVSA